MGMSSTGAPHRDALDPRYDALAHFKDWSNYLLVATVAAAGWVGSDKVAFGEVWLGRAALWCLGLSIIFGIFTLAFVPLLAEQLPDSEEPSIYKVAIEFSLFGAPWQMYLTQACRPQHVTFIAGVLLFCAGTARQGGDTDGNAGLVGFAIAIGIAVVAFAFMSVLRGKETMIAGKTVRLRNARTVPHVGEVQGASDQGAEVRHDGTGEASAH